MRSSILVTNEEATVLIDTATDFRAQAIREGIDHLDAVFYTHTHADHLHGIDDLRQLSRMGPIPIYATRQNIEEIQARFPYIFRESPYADAKPRVTALPFHDSAIRIGSLNVQPIPIFHGSLPIHGFRIGNFAYLTDCSAIPEASYPLLEGVEVVLVDALRYKPHPTHFTVSQAIEEGRRIGAGQIYLTHMCHDLEHERLERELPSGVYPAFDGLKIPIAA